MSKRQRRSREKRRRHEEGHPTRRQVMAGAGVALGATLGITGTAHATDFTVSNLNDSGGGSLRQAVLDANATPGADRILFQSGLTGTINLTSGQLEIYEAVDIVGPGAGTLTVANNGDRVAYVAAPGNQSVTISGLTLTGHDGAGGVFWTGGSSSENNLTVANSVLSGSTAADDGGAIYVYHGSLQVDSSTISGNTSAHAGGGIYFHATSAPSAIRNTTISGNTVTGGFDDGGGVYLNDDDPIAPVLIENSTIFGNTVGDHGGGIYDFSDPAALTVESSTIAGNSSADDGGGIFNYHPTTIRSTILADNTSPDNSDLTSETDPANVAFSLVERAATSFTSTGPNIVGVDPQLGPLASNGGPTQTQALAITSPAVDKGLSGVKRDQRGSGRPADLTTVANAAGGNGADIGAFELAPTCKGKMATVFSTGSHKINGTKKNDVIVGTNGKDKINGKAGKDIVCALGGKDKVKGGKGNDKLLGGKGRDTLIGGPGKDKLKGGPGRDVVKQ